ncbi:hypothetical protein ABBQ32_002038 [Trebouxia sp. C0010 RCD-2024]
MTSNIGLQAATIPHRAALQVQTRLRIVRSAGSPDSCRHFGLTSCTFHRASLHRCGVKHPRAFSLRRHKSSACRTYAATNKVTDAGWEGIAGSVGYGLIWGGLAYYAFVLSPNQTPYRDMYLLEKLSGLGADDGVAVNTVFTRLCWLMGVWPAVYASLLLPSAKSGNKVPAWPFVIASFAFGYFALGPYFALWTPIADEAHKQTGPPKKSELTGWKSWGLQATENPITSWLLFGSAALFVFQAATAGGQQWAGYSKLFDESRFCHATTIDFLALTLSAPVWMWNDSEVRQWESRGKWLPVLACIPVIGPAAYLVVRPKAK